MQKKAQAKILELVALGRAKQKQDNDLRYKASHYTIRFY